MTQNPQYQNLRDLVFHAAENYPSTRFFITDDPGFPHITGAELKTVCGKFGAWMEQQYGIGRHIALLGPNGASWLTAYFSVLSSGCVAVPLHLGSTEEDLDYYCDKADVDILLFDETCRSQAEMIHKHNPEIYIFEIHALLEQIRELDREFFPELLPDFPAALYFTSGTTALSRCVILTHRNMASHTNAAMTVLPLSPEDTGLSILPVSHTFELMTNIVGALHCGGTLYINNSLRHLKKNLQKYQPTIIVCVPLVLQMMQKEILNTAKKEGKLELLQRGLRVSGGLQHLGIDISHLMFKDIYDVVGGKLRYFMCGGASLDKKLIQFYKKLGIEVIQGYGITECTPIVSANLPDANVIGSIGRPLPCCEVRIINGEICVRGDSVSPGYYKDGILNLKAFQNGWFHTGDLGWIDRKGFIHYRGRQKNLIVLANGENVSAEALEEKLTRIDGIEEAVVSEKDGKITAELFTAPGILPDKEACWHVVSHLNRRLPVHQQIGDLILRDHEFEKTVTRKIKRRKVS